MPDVIQQTQEALAISPTAEFSKEFVGKMLSEIRAAYDDTASWRSEREIDYEYEQGLIGKENPDVPFPGAPDIRPQTALAFKRQWMGDFITPVVEAPNIVKFSGGGSAAQRQQDFWNWVYRAGLRGFRKTVNAAASRFMGSPGNCIIKVTYDYTTNTRTKADKASEELKLLIKLADQQIRLLETQGQIQEHVAEVVGADAGEQPQGPPPPVPEEQAAPEEQPQQPQPQVSAKSQIEQLRQMPLLVVAKKYGYDLDDPTDKARAQSVLRQLRSDSDVVTAIIERAAFPLKFKVLDHPCDLIVPAGTTDIQEAPWVGEMMLYDEHTLRDEEACGKFKNVDEVLGSIKTVGESDTSQTSLNTPDGGNASTVPDDIKQMRQWREIVNGLVPESTLKTSIPIFEVCCWVRRDEIERFNDTEETGNKDYVRAVVDFHPFASPDKAVLRIMEHPYDFEGEFNWPYLQGRFNDTGEGFYCGKGIPNLIRSNEKEMIESKSAAVARDMMASAPLTVWNENLMFGETSTPAERRTPGHNMSCYGDPERLLKIYQFPDLGTPLHNDYLRNNQMAKEKVGIGDTSRLPSTDRPPTAAQVNAVIQPMNSIKLWELKNFLDMWSDVFKMGFLLIKQYYFMDARGGAKQYVDDRSNELRTISEADFQHDFIIKAGGEPGMIDEQQQAQRAIAWSQLYGLNPQFAWMADPTEFGPDITALMLGGTLSKKWLKPPKDAAQAHQQFMKMQADALAARQANQQKRKGASEQAAMPQMPGANLGNLNTAAG